MHRKTPLLCLFLLLAAPAGGVAVDYPSDSDAVVPVDLIENAGQSLDFHLSVQESMADGGCLAGLVEEADARAATATLRKGTQAIAVSLLRERAYENTGGNDYVEHIHFRKAYPVDSLELVTGTWSLDLEVLDADGVKHDCGDDRELLVTAEDDDEPPVVEFPTAEQGVIRLGAGQSIAPTVTDDTLGHVEYRVDRMPRFFPLEAPYVIKSQSFFPGENELTLRATDRAGHATTERKVTVIVDGDDPELEVDLLNRTTFFAGIENPVVLNVTDESDYRVTVSFQGNDVVRDGTGGSSTEFRVGVPANNTGEELLHVRVVDSFGNRVSFARLLTVTQLTTDARIDEVKQDKARVVVGENVTIHVAMEQPEGVANVTFGLRVDGELLGEMEVPSRGSNETIVTVQLPPGRQELTVQAIAPDGVVHDAQNLTAQVRVEVYLARVLVGDDVYHVRATPQGLPDGVVAPNGTEHQTQLVQLGARSVYAFQADGQTYHYDPARPAVQEFQDPEDVTGGGNEAPGPGVLLLLGALLVALAAVRRRM